LSKEVEGEQVEFSDAVLQTMTDVSRVRKIYKLNNSGGVNGREKEDAVNESIQVDKERKELEMLILGSMALRGATN
jgi:EKC/KEOPS complex subunit CGI121/TPRKB